MLLTFKHLNSLTIQENYTDPKPTELVKSGLVSLTIQENYTDPKPFSI